MNKKLSVILVNFQSKKYLDGCLSSVYAKIAPQISTEVIIVNNDKNENLDGFFEKFHGLKIINNNENRGFGSANNTGVGYSSGDYLLFLNCDTKILSENVNELISEFEKNLNVGIIGSGLLDSSLEPQDWLCGVQTSLWDILLGKVGFIRSRRFWKNSKKAEVGWVSGTGLFITKKLFLEISGFDEAFFMYFEDMDLCKRVSLAGKKVLYFPSFSIKHFGGGSYEENRSIQKKDYYKSQDLYFEKYRGKIEYFLLKNIRKFFI